MGLDHINRLRHGISMPWRTLLLVIIATALFLFAGAAPDTLVYNQEAIRNGELWRLITGHWVHSDSQHATWNIIALFILGCLFESALKQKLFTVLLISSIALSGWIYLLMPQMTAYCGLSGILNSLLVVGTLTLWQQRRSTTLLVILLLAILKSVIEMQTQSAIFTHTVWPSVPATHLAGMLTGLQIFLYALLPPYKIPGQREQTTIKRQT